MRRLINLLSYDFWMKLWCVSHLCGCFCLDVSGIPRDSTIVSELRFDEGLDWLLVSKFFLQECSDEIFCWGHKHQRRYKCKCVSMKALPFEGELYKLMNSCKGKIIVLQVWDKSVSSLSLVWLFLHKCMWSIKLPSWTNKMLCTIHI